MVNEALEAYLASRTAEVAADLEARTGSGAGPSSNPRERSMPRDDGTLLDMLRAARLGLDFRGQLDKAAFLTDLKTQAAGMRDRLLPGYDSVDLEAVWKTLDEDLPALIARLDALAPRRPRS